VHVLGRLKSDFNRVFADAGALRRCEASRTYARVPAFAPSPSLSPSLMTSHMSSASTSSVSATPAAVVDFAADAKAFCSGLNALLPPKLRVKLEKVSKEAIEQRKAAAASVKAVRQFGGEAQAAAVTSAYRPFVVPLDDFKTHPAHLSKPAASVTDDSLAELVSEVMSSPDVTLIDVSNNALTSMGAAQLGGCVASCERLTTLSLRSNNIGDDGVKFLCSVVQAHPTLTHLDVADNGLTGGGVDHLCELLATNDTLTRLDLSDNVDIGDGGVDALHEALMSTNQGGASHLCELRLSNTGLTEAGGKTALRLLQACFSLLQVSIDRNGAVDLVTQRRVIRASIRNQTRWDALSGDERASARALQTVVLSRSVAQFSKTCAHLLRFPGAGDLQTEACAVDLGPEPASVEELQEAEEQQRLKADMAMSKDAKAAEAGEKRAREAELAAERKLADAEKEAKKRDKMKRRGLLVDDNDGVDATQTDVMPVKRGFLLKRGGRKKTRKRRYFVLDTGAFHYFRSEKDKYAAGDIQITKDAKVKIEFEYPHSFSIKVVKASEATDKGGGGDDDDDDDGGGGTDGRTFFMTANDDEDRSRWMNAVQKTIRIMRDAPKKKAAGGDADFGGLKLAAAADDDDGVDGIVDGGSMSLADLSGDGGGGGALGGGGAAGGKGRGGMKERLLNKVGGGGDSGFDKMNAASLKEGLLQKEGKKIKTVKKRHFVLLPTQLQYFAKKMDKHPKGTIRLALHTQVLDVNDTAFSVVGGRAGDRAYMLTAGDGGDKKEWITAVQKAIDALVAAAAAAGGDDGDGGGDTATAAAGGSAGGVAAGIGGVGGDTDATTPDGITGAFREGFLIKKGPKIIDVQKSWKQRYFVLFKDHLKYFKGDALGGIAKGRVYLTCETKVDVDASHGRQCAFYVKEHSASKRTFVMGDVTEEARDAWVSAVRARVAALPAGFGVGAGVAKDGGGAGMIKSRVTKRTMTVVTKNAQHIVRGEKVYQASEGEGFLEKLGGSIQNWKDRYFVLLPGKLQYFREKKSRKCAGEISISSRTVCEVAIHQARTSTFSIYIPSLKNTRKYYLSAPDDEHRDVWMRAVRAQIRRCMISEGMDVPSDEVDELAANDDDDEEEDDDDLVDSDSEESDSDDDEEDFEDDEYFVDDDAGAGGKRRAASTAVASAYESEAVDTGVAHDGYSLRLQLYVYLKSFPAVCHKNAADLDADERKVLASYHFLNRLIQLAVARVGVFDSMRTMLDANTYQAELENVNHWFTVAQTIASMIRNNVEENLVDCVLLAEDAAGVLQSSMKLVETEEKAGTGAATVGFSFPLLSGMRRARARLFRGDDGKVKEVVEDPEAMIKFAHSCFELSITQRFDEVCPYADNLADEVATGIKTQKVLADMREATEDMDTIEMSVSPCFPDRYNVLNIMANGYDKHLRALMSQLSECIAQDLLNITDYLKCVEWIQWYGQFMRDLFGDDTRLHMDAFIDGFLRAYLLNQRTKVEVWVKNIMDAERQSTTASVDSEGYPVTNAPTDLFTQLNTMLDVFRKYKLSGPALLHVAEMCTNVLAYSASQLEQFFIGAITADGQPKEDEEERDPELDMGRIIARREEDAPTDLGLVSFGDNKRSADYVMAHINNFQQYRALLETLREDFDSRLGDDADDDMVESLSDLFDDVEEAFVGISSEGIEVMVRHLDKARQPMVNKLFAAAWLAETPKTADERDDDEETIALSIVDCIDEQLEPLSNGIQNDSFYKRLLQATLEGLVTQYVVALAKKGGAYVATESKKTLDLFARIDADVAAFDEFFQQHNDVIDDETRDHEFAFLRTTLKELLVGDASELVMHHGAFFRRFKTNALIGPVAAWTALMQLRPALISDAKRATLVSEFVANLPANYDERNRIFRKSEKAGFNNLAAKHQNKSAAASEPDDCCIM
jgi:hypothetical protein